MDTSALKKFAQEARRALRDQVTAKLDLVLAQGSAARREAPGAVDKLEKAVRAASKDQVVERIAYTWFNRFSALRFMDANGYNGVSILSPRAGETRPEVLSEAMAGVIGAEVPTATGEKVRALLDGRAPSRDPQGEAYRLLVVAACNHWHGHMPFLFEPIADETELLMPDDLLSATSVPAKMRAVMTDAACKDVEIIGWLYQFYISEKKDEVFAALKKNVKITPENIPAATQLFTPHWIVRYLVENSLGRLWLLNRPQSKLAARMDYYIAPVEPETDFLPITKPEDIRICDPACGSGHMLTYAFDLLHAIYEEEGYDAAEIPALILTHNLTGIEIDDRAGALAAFALAMKAAAKLGRRRFLRLAVKPNICVLQNVRFTAAEMQDVAAVVGRDLFSGELRETLEQFEHAKNFGSLIVPKLRDPAEVARVVRLKDFSRDLLLREVQERVLDVLRMAEALAPKYHVVVANPPYMGSSGMNGPLKKMVESLYPDFKADLFSAFIKRCSELGQELSCIGVMSPNVWMYILSHKEVRQFIIAENSLINLLELPLSGFKGATVQICAFNFINGQYHNKIHFIGLREFSGDDDDFANRTVEAAKMPYCEWRHVVSAAEFEKIPGSPIAYWLSQNVFSIFEDMAPISRIAILRKGMVTANNNAFIRNWYEVSRIRFGPNISNRDASKDSEHTWFPYTKGGEYRKWFGNNIDVVNWHNDGEILRSRRHHKDDRVAATNFNLDFIFREAATYSSIGTGDFSLRYVPPGFLFDQAGAPIFFEEQDDLCLALCLMNSIVANKFLKVLSQTMNFTSGDLSKLPVPAKQNIHGKYAEIFSELTKNAKSDWDSSEISWDFTTLPLLSPDCRAATVETTYTQLRTHWQNMTDEMQRLEEENNRIFIDAYGLQDELTPEVPLAEITLTCNTAYRYGGSADAEALEARLRADTMAEFLSYAVGCMFGRYSLDAPGLILANQGDTLETYLAKVPNPTFTPTAHNVIPLLDGDWFADDVTERFREFLRLTFGEPHFAENLAFLEEALGKDIRKYFTRDFFNDHVKRYKKRPIYWLFSSPQGTFNALIYMHRYTPDTVGVLLNEYLRPFRSRLEARKIDQQRLEIASDASGAQKTKAAKEVQALEKAILEIDAWERDVIFPLAARRIAIDLDDGVKANYPKFAGAVKPIKGLEETED